MIAIVRPLTSECFQSLRAAVGTDHGCKVFTHQFSNSARPVLFMWGIKKPPELRFQFNRYDDGTRPYWQNSVPEYYYHALELTPNRVTTVKDSAPEFLGVRVLSFAGWISGATVTVMYWTGVLVAFFFAFRWAGKPGRKANAESA
jgi:hypothetical protein